MKKTVLVSLAVIVVMVSVSLLFSVEAKDASIKESNPIIINHVESVDKLPLSGKTIVLDPGHGGKDIGATGQGGLLEKDITLQTAKNIEEMLEKEGAEVILTRDGDEFLKLSERVDIAEEQAADLFISLHFDAYETSDVFGITTYYNKKENRSVAKIMQKQLFKHISDMRDRGISFGDYHVLRENTRPSVLLELGFISNKEDEQRIQSPEFQAQSSAAIVEGVIKYLSK